MRNRGWRPLSRRSTRDHKPGSGRREFWSLNEDSNKPPARRRARHRPGAAGQRRYAPYYEPQGNEIAVFEAAYRKRLPVMLKGPTGCGKTRFLEYMAFQLKRPLVTVSCHEDLTSSDLVGRFLLEGARNRLAGRAAHARGEGRRDLLPGRNRRGAHRLDRGDPFAHRPPAPPDHRKEGPGNRGARGFPAGDFLQPRLPDGVEGPEAFDQAALHRDQFRFPARRTSSARSSSTRCRASPRKSRAKLVAAGRKARLLKDHGLEEATSTRALVYAANMINAGLDPVDACQVAMVNPHHRRRSNSPKR